MTAPCTIHPATPSPEDELIARYGKLATAIVSDVFGRWAGAPGLLPVTGLAAKKVIVGPAFTVRTRPGDNLVVHKALELVEPGDFLIVAAGGATDRAIIGGLIGAYATTRHVAALAIDGAVRDKSELDELAPPVFAKGLSHLGPYKDGPGDLRGQVSLSGVTVNQGDIVIGDEDGIAVVPRGIAWKVLEAAEAKAAEESRDHDRIRDGEWDRSWIDAGLNITWI